MKRDMSFACSGCPMEEMINSSCEFVSSAGLLGLQNEASIEAALDLVNDPDSPLDEQQKAQVEGEVIDITAKVSTIVNSVDMEAVSLINTVLEGDCDESERATSNSGCPKFDKIAPLLTVVMRDITQ